MVLDVEDDIRNKELPAEQATDREDETGVHDAAKRED